jgi:hypothetical protein
MIEFSELLDTCKIESIANTFSPTHESVYRMLCREYSQKFFTPLHEVIKLDARFIILNVFESRYEKLDFDKIEILEDLLDTVYSIEDPNYERAKDEDLKNDIENYEQEEKERMERGLSVLEWNRLKKKKEESSLEEEEPQELPKSGSLDMSKLGFNSDKEG